MITEQNLLLLAQTMASLSTSARSKVGAVIYKDGEIISTGYNHIPGFVNAVLEDRNNVTLESVEHAECNALRHVANPNLTNATMYVTLSPCVNCAKKIAESKSITRVVYLEDYRITDGIMLLKYHGIETKSWKEILADDGIQE